MSDKKWKVLILYASYGDGHIQVSKALHESFRRHGVDDVLMVDLFAEAHPAINAMTRYLYLKSYKVLPQVYGWLYYGTKKMPTDTLMGKWIYSFGFGKLKEIIMQERPDLVINTFPMLVMPELRKKTGVVIPAYTVLTDFELHYRWIDPLIDKFYVATEDLKEQVACVGIPAQKINVSGIPLKESFQQPIRTEEVFEKYGIDCGKKTVLIMAGSYGVLQGLKALCESVTEIPDTQVLIVCGKNKLLLHEMKHAFSMQREIKIFGYVDEIHELMSVSHCMITKPGGITISEALITELPLLFYRPVPGQERDNANFLTSKGAAMIAYKPEMLTEQIRQMLTNNKLRDSIKQAMQKLRKTNSAETVVLDILNDMEWKSPNRTLLPLTKGG
ncbi:MGDG synthase family glycosyltransferase [Ferviditalea candida]|uniref:Glycosyltransferase n=1 Tax=Ferviditalea candida TaxID=3108399 RepID=A0ABU5ZJB9_9BACL|nr:glycosyltransferase [Paenibacillaceae bacterium T2]